jgi:hypothetical protein
VYCSVSSVMMIKSRKIIVSMCRAKFEDFWLVMMKLRLKILQTLGYDTV